MKGRIGRAGIKGQLLEKSIDAYILALETINRLSVKYRVETFAYLICNAWELLFKARIIDTSGSRHTIYYKKKRNEPRRTLSLRDCVNRVIPMQNDPIRRNVERISDLRDEAVHLVISQVPRDILCLFQACVINYHKKLMDWFGMSLSERISVGMMTIVYDSSPGQLDLTSSVMKKKLGKEAAQFLANYQYEVTREFEELGKPSEYSISIEYKLVLTKKPGEADIVLTHGNEGRPAVLLALPRDSGVSHPHRQKELVKAVNKSLAGRAVINQYDIQCLNKIHDVKKRAEWFYQGTVQGSPIQYSEAYKDWLVERFAQDNNFFADARKRATKK